MARQATNLARGAGVIPADKHPSRERGEASMFSSTLKRSVTTLAVMAGLLAVAGPAGASPTGNDRARAAGLKVDSNEFAIEGFMDYTDDALVFSGDAYDNEMGLTAAGDDVPARRQTTGNLILMADAAGQY
jgi:hypothetical protein